VTPPPTGRGPDKCGVLRRARLRPSTHHKCRPLLFKVTPAVHGRSSWSVRYVFVSGKYRYGVFASYPVTGAGGTGPGGPKMPTGRYDPSRTLFSFVNYKLSRFVELRLKFTGVHSPNYSARLYPGHLRPIREPLKLELHSGSTCAPIERLLFGVEFTVPEDRFWPGGACRTRSASELALSTPYSDSVLPSV
jgi:hypothetical protein